MILFVSLAVLLLAAWAIYLTWFGPVKGQHVNGINAMIYVQNDADQLAAYKKKVRSELSGALCASARSGT